jgi:hypothetical protein
MFSKEIKAPEVIGKPVGKTLLEELARRGHDVSTRKWRAERHRSHASCRTVR